MKKDNIFNKINNIFIYLTILLCNFLSITKILDSDLFFDLKSAKDILTYGLDFKDHTSMHEGLKYLYHHWLYDLIIYPIFKLGSYPLLFLFIFILFFIFSIVVYKYIDKHTNNKFISLLSTIGLSILVGGYFFPRVQSFSYLILLLQFIVIEKLYTTGKIKYSIISILLSIFMVNIHFPIWIMIPVFYLPYLVNMIIVFIKDKYKIKIFDNKVEYEKCNNSKIFILTFVGILISAFISPYGLLPYTFGLDVKDLYYSNYYHIGEMHRVTFGESTIELLSMFILLILALISKNKIKLSNLFYLIGLGIVGTLYYRNLPFIYIYYILISISIIFKNIKIKEINLNVNKNVILVVLIICELFLLIASISAIDFKNYQYGAQYGGEPEELADYIIENIDYKNKKFYNEFAQGSYLGYRGIPIFLDSRVEVYISKFNGKEDIFYDYYNLEDKELIEKYKFDYFVAIPGTSMYEYLNKNNYELITQSYNYYYLYKNKEAE